MYYAWSLHEVTVQATTQAEDKCVCGGGGGVQQNCISLETSCPSYVFLESPVAFKLQ